MKEVKMFSFFKTIHSHKTITLFLTFLFLCFFSQGFTGKKIKKEDQQANVSHTLQMTDEEIDKVLEGLKNLNRAILQASQEIPRDTFDPQAVIDNIGNDLISLFEWVRDETVLIPYRGSLRGPVGVLMDRCGNSLDRALLLHELLHLSGYEARLARGTLTENKAREILENIPDSQKNIQDKKSETDFKNLIHIYSQEYDIPTQELQEIQRDLVKEKEHISKIIRKRVSEQTEVLSKLLEIDQRKESGKERASRLENLKDHWWIQVEENSGWLDLDPTIRNAKPGETLTSIKKTWDAEALDEDLFHLLTIRIIVERWEEGSLKEETVLDHTLQPSNCIGERIELHHDPLDWPKDEELYNSDQPIQNLKDTVLNLKEWIPALTIGSEKIGKQSFTISGKVNKKPGEKTEQTSGGIAGGLLGAFGGSKKKSEDASKLTAEWIEFEIHSPGLPHDTIRRSVFDMIGPAKRKSSSIDVLQFSDAQILKRNLLILGRTEILPLICKVSPEFMEYLSAREMLSNMEVLINLVEDRNAIENEDILVQLDLISPLPGPLYNLALTRSSLSRFDKEMYLDGLNMFSLQTYLQENPSGELEEFQRTDIIRNDIAVVPDSTQDPFMIRMEQGVLDTNGEVEHLVAEMWTENTALIFSESLKHGIDWLVIHDAQDPALENAQLPTDALFSVKQDLADGYITVIPQKPIPVNGNPTTGWWRIDPRTGTTLGMGANGLGQALTQYARDVNLALQLKSAISIHASILRCMAAAITAPLRGNKPQHDRLFVKCIWMTVCSNASTLASKFVKIDVNWTNIIIKQTISWAMKSLCKNLWDKGIEE
jgi:hypothetical protein